MKYEEWCRYEFTPHVEIGIRRAIDRIARADEIGIIVGGPLDSIDRRALRLAIEQVGECLSRTQELDAMDELTDDQLSRQRIAFSEIADQRLEEQVGERASYPIFAIHAAWINRREIAEAIWGARPWQFPRRLSSLTIAAVSTIMLLFLTAEAWDLGLAQTRV